MAISLSPNPSAPTKPKKPFKFTFKGKRLDKEFDQALPELSRSEEVKLVMNSLDKLQKLWSEYQDKLKTTPAALKEQRDYKMNKKKGYGTMLMNHLKQHARDVDGLTHFLPYADKNAVEYLKKQGFTKEIYVEQEQWRGYINDYDEGILMECKIDPKLPYTDLSTMVRHRRQLVIYDHLDACPFMEPVDSRDVTDYYDIIRDRMDPKTMSKRVESEKNNITLEIFVADARRMFANAHTYNSRETIYYKCSTRLEAHLSS